MSQPAEHMTLDEHTALAMSRLDVASEVRLRTAEVVAARAAVVRAAVAFYDAPVGPQDGARKALMDAVAAYKAVTS